MRALTKKAIKDVTRRKLRTVLTVLGIAIGITGLSAISVASNQLQTSLQFSTDASGQADITFATAPTDPSILSELQQQPNIKVAQATSVVPARWKIPTGHEPLRIIGVSDFAALQFQKPELTAGALPAAGQPEILMETSNRSVQPFNVGDQIEIDAGGQPQQLKVSGLARTRGLPSPAIIGLAFAYMSQQSLQDIFQVSGVNNFLFHLNDYNQRIATAQQLSQFFRAHQVTVLGASVGHSDTASTMLNGIFSVMQALSIVALLLSIFLLLSTITTLVAEQVPIIGTMKAIGAARGKIIRNYLTSVAIYGVIGTVLGLVLGLGLGELLVSLFANLVTLDTGPLVISPSLVIVAIIVGIGVPLLAALLPIYLGTRITVRQALSGYGLDSSGKQRGHGWSRAVGRIASVLPETVQLGARSLFRKRTRAVLTLLALSISGAAFLCVQTTSDSFNSTLNQIFSAYHADVLAVLNTPQSYNEVQAELASVPGVDKTEPLFQDSVDTQWGTGLLTGVLSNSQIYHKHVLSGRWFTDSDQNVVLLTENGAKKSGLKVGDSIEFHNSLHSARWTIIGIARDYNNPTGMGVMLAPISQINVFEQLPADYTNTFMISSTSKNQADIDALASRIDDTLSSFHVEVTVLTAQQMIQRNQSTFLVLYVLFYSVVVIVALVGAIGLFNALAMSVLERRREIGILRSMGATGRKVMQVFLTEGVSLGVVAWLAALIIGIPAAYGFVQFIGQQLFQVPFTFNPVSLVLMLLFILIVAALASIGPVLGASRVKIAQTLRYE
jgi:putative ABC transport system permease protein